MTQTPPTRTASSDTPPPATANAHACSCGTAKTPRRWHSIAGGIFALFLAVHFCVNGSSWNLPVFTTFVGWIHAVIDFMPGITLALVFLPLFVQIASGLYLLHLNGLGYHAKGCNRGSTPRFFLQRLSGAILATFVVLHLGTLHGWRFQAVARNHSGALAGYDATHIFPQIGSPGAVLFLIGVLAAAFHVANGAINSGHFWGFIRTKREKRGWRRLCTGIGILAAIAGTAAWLGFGCAGVFSR